MIRRPPRSTLFPYTTLFRSIPAEGTIIDKQPNAFFKVKLDNSTHVVLAAVSGKMRKHRIRILVGDRVSVEMSPRSEEHTSELQSRSDLVCRLLLEKKKRKP